MLPRLVGYKQYMHGQAALCTLQKGVWIRSENRTRPNIMYASLGIPCHVHAGKKAVFAWITVAGEGYTKCNRKQKFCPPQYYTYLLLY